VTNEQKIQTVIALTSPEETVDVVSVYLDVAAAEIINRAYPYKSDVTEVPPKYDMLQCKIAAYMIQKRGAEGQTAHSENGVSRTYEDSDLPKSLTSQIIPFAGVI
jgi:hypothetical protein